MLTYSNVRIFCFRFLIMVALLTAWCWNDRADGMPQANDVEQRGLQHLIQETEKSLAARNWLDAAEKFDTAWSMACEKEDPLMVATGADVRQLAPGETESLAGGKAKLEALFHQAPENFRTEFFRQFSDVAEKQISDSITTGDLASVRRVSIRYAFCPAAQRGLSALSILAIDRGDFLEGALLLGRLQRTKQTADPSLAILVAMCYAKAGLNVDAIDLVNRLTAQSPAKFVTLGGTKLTLPESSEETKAWILRNFQSHESASSDWLQPGGSYRRFENQPRGPARFHQTWKSDLFSVQDVLYADRYNPILHEFKEPIEREAARLLHRNSVIIPTATPLISGDLVIVRSPFGIRAMRMQTGELAWEVTRPDSRLRVLVDELSDAVNAATKNSPRQRGNRYGLPIDPRVQLLYQIVRTNTASQMSINGSTLFVCDETSAATWTEDSGYGLGGDPSLSIPSNFIRAYDVNTGLFKWEVGGQTQSSSQPTGHGNLLAGYYFLGAPLVLGQRTYVLAESGEGIFLIQIGEPDRVINDANPKVLGSQLLTVPEHKLPRHPVRKHAGLVPSFAQGLLICPTCDERIIAVSAEDHSLRWVFRYAGNIRPQEIGGDEIVLFGGRDFMDTRRVDMDSRWIDSLPRIVDNKVIVTPRDSDQLYCLDLLTGRELWKAPRGAFHAIGAIAGDRLVLIGNQRASALKITDGSVLWSTDLSDGLVCGTATTNGTVIQIPTDAPSIVTLDLENGSRLVSQYGDLDKTPGNLHMTEHGILSQSLMSVTYSAQASADLQPTVADQAMELLLDRQRAKALDLLDTAVTESPKDASSRELLIEVLLETLRSNFAKNQSYVPRVRSLIEMSEQDLEIAPLMHSLVGMNLPDAAVLARQMQGRSDRYHGELTELVAKGIESSAAVSSDVLTESVRTLLMDLPAASKHSVTSGFLVRTKATVLSAGIRNAVLAQSGAQRSKIQLDLRPAASEVMKSLSSLDARQEFVQSILSCGLPELALATLLESPNDAVGTSSALLTEILRLETIRSSSENGPKAASEMIASWKDAGDVTAITSWLSDVSNPLDVNADLRMSFVDQATRDNVLGDIQKLYPEVTKPAKSIWSLNPLKHESNERTMMDVIAVPDGIPDSLVPLYGAPGIYRSWSFARVRPSGALCAYDPDGVIRWTMKTPGVVEPSRYGFAADSYFTANGHLLMLNISGTVVAVDPTQISKDGEPKVLWRKNIERLAPDAEADLYRDYVPAPDRLPQYFPQPAGFFPVGPVTPFGVPVISGRRLVVLNPITGSRTWHVDGIPRDTVLLSSWDEVLLLSEASRQIEVRSLLDGSLRSLVRLPEWWGEANANVGSSVRDNELEPGVDMLWRILLHGHSCLLFRLTTGKATLESRDLLTDKLKWSIDLPQETVFSNISGDVVALLSDGKKLKLVQADTGRILADLDVPGVTEPRDLILRESHGQYIVFPEAVDDASLEFDPVIDAMHIYGRIYAIDQKDFRLTWEQKLDHRHVRVMIPDRTTILPNAPVLVLLSRGGSVNPSSPLRRTHYGARVLDVRTGDLLFDDDDVGTTLNNHWLRIDSEKRVLELSFDRRMVTFQFNPAETPASKP